MRIRAATPQEREMWMQHPGVWINLHSAEVQVAEYNGEVIGFLCAQKVIQVEHLVLFGNKNKITRSRAAIFLYRAIEKYAINQPESWIYMTVRRPNVKKWAARLDWHRCFRGSAIFAKYLPRIR